MKRYNHKFSFIAILVGILIAFCFVLSESIFICSKISPLAIFNQSVRVVRGASVQFSVKNYEIDGSLIGQHREDFPVDPTAGKWTKDGVTQDTRWLTLPADGAQGQLENIKKFATEAKEKGYTDIVTIGMGGSSRPTDVVSMFRETLQASGAKVHVLETLDENSIGSLISSLNLETTLFIIISKSGGTAETNALAKLVPEGGNFIAITTIAKSDSELMQFLSKRGVRSEDIQEHPDDVGGRYTFFSNVGMLAAALAGIDIDVLLGEARRAMASDIKYKLGQFMFDMEGDGRKYMRIILPEKLAKLGPWIEQLVAESLGKHDGAGQERGIIAISERDFDPSVYANRDVFVVRVKLGESDERDEFTAQVVERGAPLFEFQLSSVEEVAFVMYSLKFATGMSGILMGIDPFDQPGVEGGKRATNRMKGRDEKGNLIPGGLEDRVREEVKQKERTLGRSLTEDEIFEIAKQEFRTELETKETAYRIKIADGITLDFGDFVEVLKKEHGIDFERIMLEWGYDINNAKDVYTSILELAELTGKTYSAILPYDETFKEHSAWSTARALMRSLGFNEVFGTGPVYEHSYRQYFIQGPNLGIFTFIMSKDPGELIIPDDIPGFTFSMQNALQALGTMEALVNADDTYKISRRLAVRIEIDGRFTDEVMRTLEEFFAGVGGGGG